MITSPRFLLGIAAGAAAAWWYLRRSSPRLVPSNPMTVRPITRRARMGRSWPGTPRERGSQQ